LGPDSEGSSGSVAIEWAYKRWQTHWRVVTGYGTEAVCLAAKKRIQMIFMDNAHQRPHGAFL
jgi:hypothetical protein